MLNSAQGQKGQTLYYWLPLHQRYGLAPAKLGLLAFGLSVADQV